MRAAKDWDPHGPNASKHGGNNVLPCTECGPRLNRRSLLFTQSDDGSTPLFASSSLGHIPMANLLLSFGADVNRSNPVSGHKQEGRRDGWMDEGMPTA